MPFSTLFLGFLGVSLLSGLMIIGLKAPLKYIPFHLGILTLPPVIALLSLVLASESASCGPLYFDRLSWLMAWFVTTISFFVQKYSMRYLLADRSYRKYFTLLTVTAAAASITWLSNDFRLLLAGWGATLWGLTGLIGLRKEWPATRHAAALSGKFLAGSWGLLSVTLLWIGWRTGNWEVSLHSQSSMEDLHSLERFFLNMLLVISVMIPAAQWPFQRWLLDTAIAPTPISAVMHAGIVNGGGIILTRLAPLATEDSQLMLLVISSLSVLLGTGIMLVQVDYKRQLVGSTIAQMGFMLVQCALGSYWAAIAHAVLHGLFKATQFLQSGSVAKPKERDPHPSQSAASLWVIAGGAISLAVGTGIWISSHGESYQLISAVILSLSAFISWKQLVASGRGWINKITGIILIAGAAVLFQVIHRAFYQLLHTALPEGTTLSLNIVFIFLIILVTFNLLIAWFIRNRTLPVSVVVYLWLLRLSEPQSNSVEVRSRSPISTSVTRRTQY
ncbi:NADH dehydrogenase subunit 5 [Paenibacillus sp. oral taxon 786]|uniref:NADH dehydrogenase subunit 5 n=1 Tax=Paenibacillus sp. oral taxon 786 TaxID=652715 RepID=UPI0002EEA2C7